MVGQHHIDENASEANIQPYFNAAFVKYETSPTVTEMAVEQSVKYIGLWDTTAPGNQRQNWSEKKANVNHMIQRGPHARQTVTTEIPTPQEWIDSESVNNLVKDIARTNITKKAQAWAERIMNENLASEAQWVIDNFPMGTIVAIEYYHPKFNQEANDVTDEWNINLSYEWLKVYVRNTRTRHPDGFFGNLQGTSYGNGRITIAKVTNPPNGEIDDLLTRKNIVHEVVHSTKDLFKRAEFGLGDHSTEPGLMDPQGTQHQFNTKEIKILRGMQQ